MENEVNGGRINIRDLEDENFDYKDKDDISDEELID